MDVSILLATYRRPALLARTLESFCKLRLDGLAYEVLVVDNGNPRETEALAHAAAGLPVRILVETTRGKNHALNRAIPEARGGLLVFTDDDVIVDPDWLVELAEGARRWPDHCVFGGRVLPLWPAHGPPSLRHKFLTHAYAIADLDRPEGPYSAGWVFGPNMAVRATIFQAGWRFDPAVGPDGTGTYMTGGESELLFRLERTGFGAVYLPRARVLHQVRPEQLRIEWLYGRAFRKGRWDFAKMGAGTGPRVFGVPSAVLAKLLAAYARFVATRLSADVATRFDRGVSYWRMRGMLYESRRMRLGGGRWTGGP